MESNLPLVWFFILAGIAVLFVILDGADLGFGIISLLAREDRKPRIIDSVGPQWYANETWLVIAGATLFGAFPKAYSLILSSLYIPVMMLLFGLIFRAVSTELRHHARKQSFWNRAFGAGCLTAALGQGFLLGGLLTNPEAVSVSGVGTWNWLNPISILIALGVAAAYGMIGAARMINRQETDNNSEIRRFSQYMIVATLTIFLIMMVLVPVVPSVYTQMWPLGYRLILAPLFSAITLFCLAGALLRSRQEKRGRGPYAWSVAAFLSIACAIVAIVYPYIIPFAVTIPEASSPESTQVFMIFGVGIVLPIIIFYNVYVARVFSRAKPN